MYKNSGGMSFYVQKKGRVCHAMYIFSAIFPEKPKNYVILCLLVKNYVILCHPFH
jgi:hypothetical protein